MEAVRTMSRQALDRRKYRPPLPLYVALEHLDLSFYEVEINKVVKWWSERKPVDEMAAELGRPEAEIAVLLIDLSDRGKIKRRGGGMFEGMK